MASGSHHTIECCRSTTWLFMRGDVGGFAPHYYNISDHATTFNIS
jgi:hypothetical protein